MQRLTAIHVYPVKGARGISLGSAEVTRRGFARDRRFMVVNEAGRFLTQRDLPVMARLTTAMVGPQLVLGFDGMRAFELPLEPHVGEPCTVTVFDDVVEALHVGPEAAEFLREALGMPASLVYMPESCERAVDSKYGAEGDIVSFADGFPYLLTNEASLEALNLALDAPLPMNRFRPSLTIAGARPDEEDTWAEVRIGSVRFDVVKPCTRCVVTTTDQDTGMRAGHEPLRTLAKQRTFNGRAAFGQNLIPRSRGTLHVGDELEVLARRPSPVRMTAT